MLLISASAKPSSIHGIGCFTNEDIKKGQVVWVYDPRIDVPIPIAELGAFPKPAQDFIDMYGYRTVQGGQDVMILCGDHSKHMNHADSPNCIATDASGDVNIAARDIRAGEELTCDYYSFDGDAAHKLGK